MQSSDIPSKFLIPFANSAGAGYIRTIPLASQIGVTDGAASLTDGFPPLNFLAVGAGGVPPFGQDFNGLLKQITQWSRWQGAGGLVTWDSALSTAIGGYPKGALVASTTAGHVWLCTVENNTTNPDAGGAGWVDLAAQTAQMSPFTQPFVGLRGGGGGGKTASWTIEELIVLASDTAYFTSAASLNFDGNTTGVNGMDIGSTPVSGDLSIYAIYNPTSNTWACLGCLGSTSNGRTYTGSRMPSGYSASQLVSSLTTNGSGNITAFSQIDRNIYTNLTAMYSGLANSSYTLISLAPWIPANAKTWFPAMLALTLTNLFNLYLSPVASNFGTQIMWVSNAGGPEVTCPPVPITTPQVSYYQIQPAGNGTAQVQMLGYSF